MNEQAQKILQIVLASKGAKKFPHPLPGKKAIPPGLTFAKPGQPKPPEPYS